MYREARCGGVALLTLALAFTAGSAIAEPIEARRVGGEPVVVQQGDASYYHDKFQGRETATGETFSQDKLTAASKDLPLGTKVKVTNEENGKSVTVRVNDRGPYVDGRVIDLSKKAADKLDIKKDGVAPVEVEAKPSAQPDPEVKEAVQDLAEKAPPAN
jgi:rare lipoprotein A